MRLIDADKLKKKIRHWNYNATTTTPTFSFVTEEDIDYMPTVCAIEQIRAEIDGIEINGQVDEHTMFIRTGEQVKQMALDIIDNLTKGE